MSPSNGSPLASPVHHPDLSEEVATLSTKLINAINHQTFLDDTLSATRHELEAAKERIRELEATNAKSGARVKRHLGNGHSGKSVDRSRGSDPKPHRGK